MQSLRVACLAAMTFACALTAGAVLVATGPATAGWNEPWKSEDRAIVIDAYEFNPIDWRALTSDKRIAGFINKASDGLPPEWNCRGTSGTEELLCKNRWWKYSVTKELYMTRREMAKTLGLKWGAYHLGRPGNPREQADHFIDFAEPADDELIALDIEDNTDEWMSLADAEIFANQIFIRTGRYPVLYTNGSTAKWIADYRDDYRLLSRLPIWYARYRGDITGLFPEDNWPTYALWQFSSMHNCSENACPYRVKGAKTDIDVNVSSLDVAGLRAAWPFADLVRPLDEVVPETSLVAELETKADAALSTVVGGLRKLAAARGSAVAEIAVPEISAPERPAAETPTEKAGGSLIASYGPAEGRARIDPLQLLTETALKERQKGDALQSSAVLLARTAPKSIVPHKRVKLASLGSLSGLQDEMKDVGAIAERPLGVDAAKAGVKTPGLGAAELSKIRQWLQVAEAKQAQEKRAETSTAVSMAVAKAGADRGPRLSASLRPAPIHGRSGKVSVLPEARIAGAFHATR